MTLLVRDEADIIGQNIEYHLNAGVDQVVAIDNGSQDGTRELLAAYESQGVLLLIDEPGRNYDQSGWMTRAAFVARDELRADRILHNDADEFWVPASGDLKAHLGDDQIDIWRCERKNMVYASDSDDQTPWHRRCRYRVARPVERPRIAKKLFDPLPCPYFYLDLVGKIITRASGLVKVLQGNARADFANEQRIANPPIVVYHFPVRSRAQFRSKVENGGSAYASNTIQAPGIGWHWRRWHRMLMEEGLDRALSDALPDTSALKADIERGVAVEDLSIGALLGGLHP